MYCNNVYCKSLAMVLFILVLTTYLKNIYRKDLESNKLSVCKNISEKFSEMVIIRLTSLIKYKKLK